MTRFIFLLLIATLSFLLPAPSSARAAGQGGDRLVYEYVLASDRTHIETVTRDIAIRSEEDIQSQAAQAFDFDPEIGSLDIIEAWVEEPDGTRRMPAEDAIFVRPSAAARTSPGFVSTQTKTVIMPPLQTGSRVHVKYIAKVSRAPALGFNDGVIGSLDRPTELRVSAQLPASLPLAVSQRGGFVVTDTTEGELRRIEATLKYEQALIHDEEPHAVSTLEVAPIFLMSTLKNFEEIGAIYYRNSIGKSVATPDIKALATKIVGGRTGLEAARAIHDWVAGNIRYLAVWIGPDTGIVPHDAETVLKNGYGDCKDHVALMQALLAAVNIRSAPALVNLGNLYKPLPLWVPIGFNHAMVYLPDFDIYANPTSPFASFGVLERLLSGKTVIIASETPEVRTTPVLKPHLATFSSDAKITIAADGTAVGSAHAKMSPAFEADMRSRLASTATAAVEMQSWMRAMPQGGFGQIKTTPPHDLDAPFVISISWRSPHAVSPSEPYILLPSGPDMAPLSPLRGYLSRTGKRSIAMDLGVADVTWTATIALPAGQKVKELPPVVNIDNDVASYSAAYEAAGQEISVRRRLVFKRNIVAAKDYPDIEAVIYAALSDRQAIVALENE